MSPLRSLFSIFFLSTLLFPSHGIPYNLHLPEIGEGGHYVVPNYLEGYRLKTKKSTTMVLAAERTRRKDPSNDFKYYTGGWNISNIHYQYSAAFSAAPLFIIAIIWFAGCGVSLFIVFLFRCCCRRKSYGYSQTINDLSLTLISLFIVTTIVGCIILYEGQGKFFISTSKTLQYVLNQANTTTQNLKGLSKSLAAAKNMSFGSEKMPIKKQIQIGKVQSAIASATKILESQPCKTQQKIDESLDKLSLALKIVAAVILILAILGFSFSIFGLQSVVYIFVTIGWVVVAGTFIMCAVFLVLHNVVGDTCVAMNEWVHNPAAHTALDDILPCVDNATAHDIFDKTKKVVHELVIKVNKDIGDMEDVVSYNKSYPLVPLLCNPYNSDLSDRICKGDEVNFTDAPKVWVNHVCDHGPPIGCAQIGAMMPDVYVQMNNLATVTYGINNYGPFLINLLDCSFVRDTFAVIHRDRCPRLLRYSNQIYIGLVMVSVAVMLSLFLWLLYARERRHLKCSEIVAPVGDSLGENKVYPYPEIVTSSHNT